MLHSLSQSGVHISTRSGIFILHKIALMQPKWSSLWNRPYVLALKSLPLFISACLIFLHFLHPLLSSSYHMKFFKTSYRNSVCKMFYRVLLSSLFNVGPLTSTFIVPPPHHCSISSISRPALTNHSASKPGGGVKKVTGVGGTTYEISVWAADLLITRRFWDTTVTGLVLLNRAG